MRYVVSYDIPDNKRRTRLAKTIKDFGDRVQYSVFECILDGKLMNTMVARINDIIKDEDDSVRIYALCANCEKVIKIMGQGETITNEDVYIV